MLESPSSQCRTTILKGMSSFKGEKNSEIIIQKVIDVVKIGLTQYKVRIKRFSQTVSCSFHGKISNLLFS